MARCSAATHSAGTAATGSRRQTEITLLGGDRPAAANRARILADAVTLVRDLVNTGPRTWSRRLFAAEAERVAAASGLEIEVLDEKALADGGYGGILGVGQGSVHPPRLVRLGYSHPDAAKTVVFAGKGITFDSGGLSLKPAKGHGGDEVRHGRRGRRPRGDAGRRRARPGGERRRVPAAGREHAERHRAAARPT